MNTSFQPRPPNKTAVNDITGKEIATHYNNSAYVNGWDLIWGTKEDKQTQEPVVTKKQMTIKGPYGLTIEESMTIVDYPNKEPYDPDNFNPHTMDHPIIHVNRFFE